MKTLKDYISYDEKTTSLDDYIKNMFEDGEDDEDSKEEKDEKTTQRGNIKFTIWESPDKKVTWLDDNKSYQKIEYKLEDKDKGLSIDFLLGFKNGSWRLWIGKIGSCSYDDDPYCDFETEKFSEAIVNALDKVEEFLEKVENDKEDYVQYYIDTK